MKRRLARTPWANWLAIRKTTWYGSELAGDEIILFGRASSTNVTTFHKVHYLCKVLTTSARLTTLQGPYYFARLTTLLAPVETENGQHNGERAVETENGQQRRRTGSNNGERAVDNGRKAGRWSPVHKWLSFRKRSTNQKQRISLNEICHSGNVE